MTNATSNRSTRNDGQVQEAKAPEATTNQPATPPAGSTDETSGRASMAIQCPPQFKVAIEAAAKAQDKSVSEFVRNALAPVIGYSGPMLNPTARKTKYSSPEEKEKAQKAAAKDRRDLTAMLLKQYREQKAKEEAEAAAPTN